jgi:hypothetical protein
MTFHVIVTCSMVNFTSNNNNNNLQINKLLILSLRVWILPPLDPGGEKIANNFNVSEFAFEDSNPDDVGKARENRKKTIFCYFTSSSVVVVKQATLNPEVESLNPAITGPGRENTAK